RGCSKTISQTIPNTGSLNASATVNNLVSCFGGSNGAATATPSGGTAPFSYLWTNGATTALASNLGAGSHSVTITDANGCMAFASVNISQPAEGLHVEAVTSPDQCGTSTGSITAIARGGTQPYTYSWNSLPNELDPIAGSLPSGNYAVTVTDANGCDTTVTAVLPSYAPLQVQLDSVKAVSCFGAQDGQVYLSISGGRGNLTYNWGAGEQSALPGGFAAGTYTLQVRDTALCSSSVQFIIQRPAQIVASATVFPVSCYGRADGRINILASGGSSALTYQWSDGASVAIRAGLAAGTYSCTIEDANGCSTILDSLSIIQPANLELTLTARDPDCGGLDNGTVTSLVTGGTAPYDYKWSNNVQTASLTGLGAGTYILNVTDFNGCAEQDEANLRERGNFKFEVHGDSAICFGEGTMLAANVTQGNSQYTFTWDHGVRGEQFLANPAETTTYQVTATDLDGCIQDTFYTVVVHTLPEGNIFASATKGCAPFCPELKITNAMPEIEYTWDISNAQLQKGLSIRPCFDTPGVYPVSLTMTNDFGCTNTILWDQQLMVYPNPEAIFSASPKEATLEEPHFRFRNMSKGANSYYYEFGDPANSFSTLETPSFSYRDSGSYQVKLIVSNEAGCTDSTTITVYVGGLETFYLPSAFTPNEDNLNDQFKPKFNGQSPFGYEMRIFNRWGEEIFFSNQWENGWDGTYQGQKVPADMYVCKVRYYSKSGKSTDQISSVTVTE
ncbi:MAG: gliding motility-associated C-terminal domain-containing protein, partial [Bacteroidia bacterium]|nr:gliding motility-associated C-terminal domain-containing protein [Bacteroidia bacterium]